MVRSLLILSLALSIVSLASLAQDSAGLEQFENKIRPILAARCYSCHSAQSKPVQGGLRLDGRSLLLKGGGRGPGVVAGKPDESLILKAIRYGDHSLQMPPKGRIPQAEIDAIAEWIRSGAAMPEARSESKVEAFDLWKRAKALWSFQPIRRTRVPTIENPKSKIQNPIDRFILSKLLASGLQAAPQADRRTLIRRVTFDLIGLPPTLKEVEAFVNDRSPNAWAKVVDRLLASPHYGERWARHWLDLVRYAETHGHEFDFDKPGAYEYRDYVIRAFNADVPYDQFATEHVAGDLLMNPRRGPDGINESVIGTGFWQLSEGTHSPVDVIQDESDRIANQLDVFSKSFLGLSVGCARCHDHKFDPISTKDYYALAGYVRSSRYHLEDITPPDRYRDTLVALDAVNTQIRQTVRDQLPLRSASTLNISGHVDYETLVNFHTQSYQGWFVHGPAFGRGPITDPTVRLDSKGTVAGVIARGWAESGAISTRLEGVLRSPTFTIQKPNLMFHVRGRACKLRLVVDGFQLIQAPIYGGLMLEINNDGPAWVRMDVSKWIGQRAYVELIDDGDGYIAMDRVLASDSQTSSPSESAPIELSSSERADLAGRLSELRARRTEIEATLPGPRRVMATVDGTAWDEPVHIRGSYKTLGQVAPRMFLEACGGAGMKAPSDASGRLELARKMTSPSNPLLARVIANRVWQHHFGEGIVRSPDDFGNMGQKPTHPDLLDWLASYLRDNSWSLKTLHRLILSSETYRMSSRGGARADVRDPQNKLLHRMPVRRLEAECIRDSILAVSGRLDKTMFGPGVMPYLTPQMEGRGRPKESGPLDGAGRRSIYLAVRRNFLNPMLLTFDFPVPFTCMGRRTVSNVPAQALTLMNNPFVVEKSGLWAANLLSASDLTQEQRIVRAYEVALARPPTASERQSALRFLSSRSDPQLAWQALCHVLINVKEFIFVR